MRWSLLGAGLCAGALLLMACGDDAGSEDDGGTGAGGQSATASSSTGGPTSSSTGAGGMSGGAYFPNGSWIYEDVSNAPVHPESSTITQWLDDNGGWGTGIIRIDFSIEVLTAEADTPYEIFTPNADFYEEACDEVPFPLPAVGALEGEDGFACDNGGDCHLIVVDRRDNRLYEMYRASVEGGTFFGGCVAAWDMTRVYGPEGRGEQCTSADAAGFPIAPLLFTAEEVANGEIPHAIRFILPNSRMRAEVFTKPATHAGAPNASGPAPVYGSRWRLRSDFDLNQLPNEGARTVARAMQRYGMVLADGGNIALTAQSDRFTDAKWDGLLEPRDLELIQPTDFEVIDTGPNIDLTRSCVRSPY